MGRRGAGPGSVPTTSPAFSPAFNEHERTVIRYATEMTEQVQIADTTFDALRAFLNEEQIVELSLNTAFYNMVVRFLTATQVDLEPDAKETGG